MDDNMQMPSGMPPASQMPEMKSGMNKMVVALIVVVVVAAAVVGWWWMIRSGKWSQSSPTTAPAAESDPDINELNSINADQNLDAEFQQINQDLNTL